MNSPNDIQASKMQNQPHISSQLCPFCFQYLCLNPLIEFLDIPGQTGSRKHSHNSGIVFVTMSDDPFAESCKEVSTWPTRFGDLILRAQTKVTRGSSVHTIPVLRDWIPNKIFAFHTSADFV